MKNLILIASFQPLFIFLLIMNAAAQDRRIIENISSSRYLEFAPAVSGDGKTMIFQQMRKDRWALLLSRLTSPGVWSQPEPLDQLNSRFMYISGPCLSYDGKTLYFTAYEEIPGATVNSEDIYFCKNVDGRWTDPENLGRPVNSFQYEGYPAISPDGRTLYFMRENMEYAKDKDAKVHCFVLYKSEKDVVGMWQDPVALPYPVNFNCERSPKIMTDGKTLMFSSLRANGKGGFDIYQSRLKSDGMWTEPEPLDYINTEQNDQSPCILPGGETIYFYCDGDIYEAPIPEDKREFGKITLFGRVIDAVYKLGLSVNIEIINKYSGERIAAFDNTESDGKFSVDLLKGLAYDFNIIQDNYFTYTFPLDLTDHKTQSYLEKDFELFSNLNLKIDVVDQKTQDFMPADQRVVIRMDRTPREEIYLLKFNVENYREASTFLDLNEVRRDPDFKKKVELVSLF